MLTQLPVQPRNNYPEQGMKNETGDLIYHGEYHGKVPEVPINEIWRWKRQCMNSIMYDCCSFPVCDDLWMLFTHLGEPLHGLFLVAIGASHMNVDLVPVSQGLHDQLNHQLIPMFRHVP